MWVKKIASALVALALAVTVVTVLSGPAEAAGKPCRNIAHRAMWKHTENQVRGVKENARWGFTEVDARLTADNKIVAMHDVNMARATGGKSRKPVGSLTLRQIRQKKFVLGRRVETTRRLIKTAGNRGSSIMVTINSYAKYKKEWNDTGLQSLWNAAKLHPKTSRVYFGGPGGEKAMQAAFPKASIFHRYSRTSSNILEHATSNDFALVAIPSQKFDSGLVSDLKSAGIRVATTQLNRKKGVRSAQKVGIRLMQTDRSRRTVRRWCR